ncbi:hypothetical protein ANANG_G00199130 [Anguilla anguilla]|uniref:Uncharacterized protein n=1 Tax=Anguilla anguilla TaxID=7936 RepID=A0A9D3M4A8_ANGAN|nr:hypothetical protein ANANG_G00199130 [Anguilla anguilla]
MLVSSAGYLRLPSPLLVETVCFKRLGNPWISALSYSNDQSPKNQIVQKGRTTARSFCGELVFPSFLPSRLDLSLHEVEVLLKQQVWCVLSWVEYPDTAVPEVSLRTIMIPA